MSAEDLSEFLDSVVSDTTRPGYLIVLTAHYILLYGGGFQVKGKKSCVSTENGVYSLCINEQFLQKMRRDTTQQPATTQHSATAQQSSTTQQPDRVREQSAGGETVPFTDPYLGVLEYVSSSIWSQYPSPRNLSFAWCSVGDSTVLCHVLEQKSENLDQIGSLSFAVSDFVEGGPKPRLKNAQKAIDEIGDKIRQVLTPPQSAAPGAGSASPPGSRPNAPTPAPRPDGSLNGMLIGPHSAIFGQPRNPNFQYDPIDPFHGSGEPWPDDDVHGNLPRSAFPSRHMFSAPNPFRPPPPRGGFGPPPF